MSEKLNAGDPFPALTLDLADVLGHQLLQTGDGHRGGGRT
jgi:hypothetical protein